MKKFAELYRNIDCVASANIKVRALVNYFRVASDQDKLWALALFTHRRPKRITQLAVLREWALETCNLPEWLFEESHRVVGDMAETIALVLPQAEEPSSATFSEWMEAAMDYSDKSMEDKESLILRAWSSLSRDECFLFNKVITGGFRSTISEKLIIKALSVYLGEEENRISHRLMGTWRPQTTTFAELLLDSNWKDDLSCPYPFYRAYPLDVEIENFGKPADWTVEYKWDGLRIQFIKRKGEHFLWSGDEELVTAKFPEFDLLKNQWADNFVIDGELVVYKNDRVQPFQSLQKRFGRKRASSKTSEEYPVAIISYDLLEFEGHDIRRYSFSERRKLLTQLISSAPDNPPLLLYSDEFEFNTWEEVRDLREGARKVNAEGLMLKKKDGTYKKGRKKGEWWKWKLDPLVIDGVMLYANRDPGGRSNLITDFTFAVWDEEGSLVPFAKASLGLTDEALAEVTIFVNQNTLERFGPVRSVKPELVFEVAFDGINRSTRHKSGVTLRFPRISKWKKEKRAQEANKLEDLKSLLNLYENES